MTRSEFIQRAVLAMFNRKEYTKDMEDEYFDALVDRAENLAIRLQEGGEAPWDEGSSDVAKVAEAVQQLGSAEDIEKERRRLPRRTSWPSERSCTSVQQARVVEPRYTPTDNQMHKLWSWAVGLPGYDKKAWQELERLIFELALLSKKREGT